MSINKNIMNYLDSFKKISSYIYGSSEENGYWSNLSKNENKNLMSMLKTHSTRESIKSTHPEHIEVIFSEKRPAALELLQLSGSEVALDLGCMWGALTIPMAKQVDSLLAIDQTIESLKFSEARATEEHVDNIRFLCANLRDITLPKETFNIAIVNGVLEWIPEVEQVVVNDYWYSANARGAYESPGKMQKDFLENVYQGLKLDGRLMLAIENRYDYKMFFGERDPHAGILFTSFLPRGLANLISKIFKRREYRPWIYSFNGIQELLEETGFTSIELYAVWPDYRMPDHIRPYGEPDIYWSPISARKQNGKLGFKRVIANRIEWLLFSVFNLQFFAPSIIAIAKK